MLIYILKNSLKFPGEGKKAKLKRYKNYVCVYIYIYIFKNHCFCSYWSFIIALKKSCIKLKDNTLPFLRLVNKGISKLQLEK